MSQVPEYLSKEAWRIKENANQGFSIGGLMLNVSGKDIADYWLAQVYTPKIAVAHLRGSFHIHDLNFLGGYCAGWSLKQLLIEGYNGVSNKVESGPPHHFATALRQIVNFLGTMQNEWAGAQALSSFDTYLAPFVAADGLSYEEVKRLLESFIYDMNVPSRWGCQSPFTNLTFDLVCPKDMENECVPFNLGVAMSELKFSEFQDEMDMINKAFCEIMLEGDSKGRVFTFPIPTYNITPEFDWDSPIADMIFEMTAKYGIPYFSNFLNSDMNPSDVRSMCCRLRLDLRELKSKGNGLFGSGEQTGSIGVVTINLAQLGYLCREKSKSEFFMELDKLLILAKESLEIKRAFLKDQLSKGLYPYTKRYLGTYRNHFSTIGVNGMNECLRNLWSIFPDSSSMNIEDPKCQAMAIEILEFIRGRMVLFQEETGNMYNLEATPAEGTAYRFARVDRSQFGDKIIQAKGTNESDEPYYTNSSQLPADTSLDLFDSLIHQESLQTLYTGGTVFHVFQGESMDGVGAKALIRKILNFVKIPYVTLTPTFSVCPTHGYLKGNQPVCPECGDKTEVWTRVMGYLRPTSEFNAGKATEAKMRRMYDDD